MSVYDAVKSRRSVRNYTDRPVDRKILERVLTAAARTPSGGNLQPWRTYVVTGKPHSDLIEKMAARLADVIAATSRSTRSTHPT
ncbi:Nitroreductase [Rhodococcus wratislaviensis]|uniref:Nitroreductase n=1 Tax=Rhodococcus wratislaviensis TaxID=44752 RepID=A0A402CG42_RHOWR|nr:nitroreductase family protein [Rhodococcus wratislaviensis]GCE42524.1 Nitroreductase [Rhodococcus wratislaviensis]